MKRNLAGAEEMPKFLKDSIKQLGMNDLASKDPVVSASESHRKDNSINNGRRAKQEIEQLKTIPVLTPMKKKTIVSLEIIADQFGMKV